MKPGLAGLKAGRLSAGRPGRLRTLTPLAWAAHNGHDETVRVLLEWEEVNSDEPDNPGQTPLSFAAQNGHEEVVRILERKEVNPDKRDSYGLTPLSHAAQCGRVGVTKILLG